VDSRLIFSLGGIRIRSFRIFTHLGWIAERNGRVGGGRGGGGGGGRSEGGLRQQFLWGMVSGSDFGRGGGESSYNGGREGVGRESTRFNGRSMGNDY
jgi:hypothetical protein